MINAVSYNFLGNYIHAEMFGQSLLVFVIDFVVLSKRIDRWIDM
jgi:hypothetical protein